MQEEAEFEYVNLKNFLLYYAERYLKIENLPPERRPIACLEALEKTNMKMAFSGLRQAIHDCVEMSFRFDHAEVERLDSQLRGRGLITLSELRRRYSKNYTRIIRRGRIKNEVEYYLIRNVIEDPTAKTPEERELLEKLVSNYMTS
jgi:hypothetical protein